MLNRSAFRIVHFAKPFGPFRLSINFRDVSHGVAPYDDADVTLTGISDNDN